VAIVGITALVGVGALANLTAGAQEGGDAAPLHIHKTVVGTVPAGTTFTVTTECNGNIDGPDTNQATVVFDAQGTVVSGDETIYFGDPGDCTVTETQNGGAQSTTYACADNSALFVNGANTGWGGDATAGTADPTEVAPLAEGDFCAAFGPQAEPMVVHIEDPDQDVTVTITNTFPLEVSPTFTG
jgi:hypothetical protein